MTGSTRDADLLVLEAADARLEVSPLDGGRISSLVVHGCELLAPSTTVPGEPLVPTMTWRWWPLD